MRSTAQCWRGGELVDKVCEAPKQTAPEHGSRAAAGPSGLHKKPLQWYRMADVKCSAMAT